MLIDMIRVFITTVMLPLLTMHMLYDDTIVGAELSVPAKSCDRLLQLK